MSKNPFQNSDLSFEISLCAAGATCLRFSLAVRNGSMGSAAASSSSMASPPTPTPPSSLEEEAEESAEALGAVEEVRHMGIGIQANLENGLEILDLEVFYSFSLKCLSKSNKKFKKILF